MAASARRERREPEPSEDIALQSIRVRFCTLTSVTPEVYRVAMSRERDTATPEARAHRRWLIGLAITITFGLFGAVMAVLAYTKINGAPSPARRSSAPAARPRGSAAPTPAAPAASTPAPAPAPPPATTPAAVEPPAPQ